MKKKALFYRNWPKDYSERFECDIPVDDVVTWILTHF